VSRLSRQCGILNISQPYRPPRPVMRVALLYCRCLRHYAATRKVSNHTMALGFTQALTGLSTRRYFLDGKARPARKADNLTPCLSRLPRKCEILDISRPPRPVTRIALHFYFYNYHNSGHYLLFKNTKFSNPVAVVAGVRRQETSPFRWTHLSRFYLKAKTESSLRYGVF
jgi:hypothetical protein